MIVLLDIMMHVLEQRSLIVAQHGVCCPSQRRVQGYLLFPARRLIMAPCLSSGLLACSVSLTLEKALFTLDGEQVMLLLFGFWMLHTMIERGPCDCVPLS